MSRVTWTDSFKHDIRILSDEVFQHALKNHEPPLEAEEKFKADLKSEIIRIGGLIESNPFACQAYSKTNPTRRGILFKGQYILEYQTRPLGAVVGDDVTEIFLTALVPAQSERYKGAYDDIESANFDDLFETD